MLVAHVIARHYPGLAAADNPAQALLQEVVGQQAQLVARWQLVGFIHGVMNTDNMLLSGETIDYGPCAFMDDFNPDTVYSSIDHGGRYAYRNQPRIAHWNLVCLAQTLLPLLHEVPEQAGTLAQDSVDAFPDKFLDAHQQGIACKLGFRPEGEEDESLLQDLVSVMAETSVDFTLSFRRLADLANGNTGDEGVGAIFEFPQAFNSWLERWRARLKEEPTTPADRQESMYAANPAFVPRNHLVEEAIEAATSDSDFKPFHALVERLTKPFEYDPSQSRLALPPRPEQVVRGVSPFTVDLGVRFEPQSRWYAQGTLRITADQNRVASLRGETPTAGAEVINLDAGWRSQQGFGVSFRVLNLANRRYVNHLNAKNPFLRTAVPEPGRFVYGRASYSF